MTGPAPVTAPERPINADKQGKWRCWLCPTHRWRKGTLRDAHDHYRTNHHPRKDMTHGQA